MPSILPKISFFLLIMLDRIHFLLNKQLSYRQTQFRAAIKCNEVFGVGGNGAEGFYEAWKRGAQEKLL